MSAMTCPCCGQPITAAVRDPKIVIDVLPVGPAQRRILTLLADRFGRYIGNADLENALYADAPDGGPDTASRVVDVHISRLRRLLADTPLAIEADTYNGFHSGGKGGWRGARRLVWRSAA